MEKDIYDERDRLIAHPKNDILEGYTCNAIIKGGVGCENGELLILNIEDYNDKTFLLECYLLVDVVNSKTKKLYTALRRCYTIYPKKWNKIEVGNIKKIYGITTPDNRYKDLVIFCHFNKDSSKTYLSTHLDFKDTLLEEAEAIDTEEKKELENYKKLF